MSSDSSDYSMLASLITIGHVSITMADLELVLIAAALVGAGLNVARGYAKTDDETNFSFKKALGAGIAAGIAALAAVQVFDVTTLGGITQTILLGLLTGFSADVSITKLKNVR